METEAEKLKSEITELMETDEARHNVNQNSDRNTGHGRVGLTYAGYRALFDRHGRVSAERLSAEAVCLVVRERVAAAGYDPIGYSGHSLRSGFATSAAAAGVSSWRIRQQAGHASDAMLARYVRDGQLFIDNAAGALL